MRHLFSVLTLTGALLFSAAAHADTIVDTFNFTGVAGYSGTFTINGTTDPYSSIEFDITSVTGTISGPGVAGGGNLSLVPITGTLDSQHPIADPTSGFTIDDVYYLGGAYTSYSTGGVVLIRSAGTPFDIYGLLLTDGTNYYNFFGDGTQTALVALTHNGPESALDFLDLAKVPEPSSLALCGTGVLAMAGAFRRKFNKG